MPFVDLHATCISMVSSVTILVGSDPFLLSREILRIQKQTLKSGEEDFNLDRLSFKERSVGDVLNLCCQLPMMAERRLVIAKECEEINKKDLEVLGSYFENPCPSTHLVLVAAKIDKRLKAWQVAAKKGWVQELKAPYPNQLPFWILTEAKHKGLVLEPAAAQMLADVLGVNPMAVIMALEQLQIFAHPRTNISAQQVKEIVGGLFANTVFDFVDRVGHKQLAHAANLMHELLAQGEAPVKLAMLLTRHFRLLWLAQEAMAERLSEPEIAKRLQIHPFFVRQYVTQCRLYSSQALKVLYNKMGRLDAALKLSPLNARHLFYGFINEVCLA